ncbi:MAG: DHHA1 domain-containing protein, partial [Nitrospiraceae bacterium]|nr:DHHA1 domain-containing protein [Nitrospiraceae bacterium]
MDIITCHLNADFDAFSSMVAAGKLYPGAWLVFPGAQEKRVRDFIADFPFAQTGIRKIREVEPGKVSRLIVVDAGTPGRLGPLAELLSRPGVEVHVYDHHPHGEGGIRGAIEVIEPIGATITILIEMLREKKIKPTPLEASLMGLGLYEETGGFLFPSTTERDILAMAHLFKNGASARIISRYMKTEFFGRKEVSLLGKLLENSRDIVVRGIRVRIAKATAGDYVLDAAQLAHSIMDAEEIDALLMMVSMKGKIILVGRSRAPEVDVAGVLAEFGGGGHRYAASATITDLPLEILEEKLEDAIKRHVRPELTAGDVMTRPVVTIDWSDTIAQAQKSMTIYGVNVLPVVRDGHYTGIISREVVEKAMFHG